MCCSLIVRFTSDLSISSTYAKDVAMIQDLAVTFATRKDHKEDDEICILKIQYSRDP